MKAETYTSFQVVFFDKTGGQRDVNGMLALQ